MKDSTLYYVAVVPINQFGQVLLGKRTEDGIWTTPAGGGHQGEQPLDCAVRECWEEAQLIVAKDKLEPLDVVTAPNGKPVHCFLYRTAQNMTSTISDPDKEVKEWKWYASSDLPKGLNTPKNANRLETINLAFIKFLEGEGLAKGRPAMPIGSHRDWNGKTYVKTADGWEPKGGKTRKRRTNAEIAADKAAAEAELHDAYAELKAKLEAAGVDGATLHAAWESVKDSIKKPKAKSKSKPKVKAKPKPKVEVVDRDAAIKEWAAKQREIRLAQEAKDLAEWEAKWAAKNEASQKELDDLQVKADAARKEQERLEAEAEQARKDKAAASLAAKNAADAEAKAKAEKEAEAKEAAKLEAARKAEAEAYDIDSEIEIAKEKAKVENSKDDPRQAAEKARDDSDYFNAVDSVVSNIGEDLWGTARHKRGVYSFNLADMERDGTAEKFLTKKNLQKELPVEYPEITKDNADHIMLTHLMLGAFPAKPPYKSKRRGRQSDAEIREAYKNAFEDYQNTVLGVMDLSEDELFARINDGKDKQYHVSKDSRKSVEELRMDLLRKDVYALQENAYITGDDYYGRSSQMSTATSDMFSKIRSNSLGTGSFITSAIKGEDRYYRPSKTSTEGKYVMYLKNDARKEDPVGVVSKAALDGKSVAQSLGEKAAKKYGPADIYVGGVAKRVGGKQIPKTIEAQTDMLENNFKMKGVIWGNSVTAKERISHLEKANGAFSDLADILDIPDEMASYNGRIVLSIGATGHGTAMAHYSHERPYNAKEIKEASDHGVDLEGKIKPRNINLTRENGVGSLAHEWFHLLDNVVHEIEPSNTKHESPFLSHYGEDKSIDGGRISNTVIAKLKSGDVEGAHKLYQDESGYRYRSLEGFESNVNRVIAKKEEAAKFKAKSPMHAAMADIKDSEVWREYETGVRAACKRLGGKPSYWAAPHEMMARAFEAHVQHKLVAKGRTNTYLSAPLYAYDNPMSKGIYPSPEMRDKLEPMFDKLIKGMKDQGALHKALEYLDLRDKLLKSTVQMAHLSDGGDVDTGSFAVERANADPALLELLQSKMEGFELGGLPVEIELDKGVLYLVKIEDGLYTGSFKYQTEVEGFEETLDDNAKVRIERQTLPTLAHTIVAKEWLVPQIRKEPVAAEIEARTMDQQYEALDAKLSEIEEGVESAIEVSIPSGSDLRDKIRVLELVNKLLS